MKIMAPDMRSSDVKCRETDLNLVESWHGEIFSEILHFYAQGFDFRLHVFVLVDFGFEFPESRTTSILCLQRDRSTWRKELRPLCRETSPFERTRSAGGSTGKQRAEMAVEAKVKNNLHAYLCG